MISKCCCCNRLLCIPWLIMNEKLILKTMFLFHAFIICFHKDSCTYWNQSHITEGEKSFSIVDKSSVGLHGFLKTPSFNVSQEGERRGIKAILNSKRLWRLEVSCVQAFFCMCCCFSYPFFNLLVNYFSLEAVAWTCPVKKLF